MISDIKEQYDLKGNSAITREESFINTFNNFKGMIIHYPFGMPLAETTFEAKKNKLYSGSNFTPVIYLQTGGIISMIGYILILFISFKIALQIYFFKKNSETIHLVVSISIFTMLPYIVQRTTIWDSPIFALLFAPVILEVINKQRFNKTLLRK